MTLRCPSFWAAATRALIPPPAVADVAVAQFVEAPALLLRRRGSRQARASCCTLQRRGKVDPTAADADR